MRSFRPLSLLLVSLACSALAQTHFCVAGDLDHLTASQVTDCREKMMTMREAVRHRGAPSGWHFVAVCDDAGWADYATFIAPHARSMGQGAAVEQAAFHTDEALRWTFLRGSRMLPTAQAADTLLTAALHSIPNPGTTPHNLPNERRVLRQRTLSVAKVEVPQLP